MSDARTDPLAGAGLIPVITIDRAEDAGGLAEALVEGGIRYAEITFRTPAAAEAIERMRSQTTEMRVGAGTVLSVEQAEQAVAAGAQYLISPALDAAVIDWCEQHSVAIVPGVATASEVNAASQRGLRTLKLFPAEPLGGVALLRALAGPFPEVRFVPTGGLTPDNLADYARQPNVAACGGSWIASREAISAQQFDKIATAAREACLILERAGRQPSQVG